MLLVKPSATIEFITPDALQLIERAGRVCYKSEDRIGPGTAEKFAEMIVKRGHDSVLEHASATVRFVVDRGVSHELVRHRVASFSQESTRYCDYEGGRVAFVIPPWVDVVPGMGTVGKLVAASDEDAEWLSAMAAAAKHYKRLRTAGWRPEQARSVLPNSLKTEIVVTANFREWRHIFNLRCAPAAHPQMREVMIPLREKFQILVPVVFGEAPVLPPSGLL